MGDIGSCATLKFLLPVPQVLGIMFKSFTIYCPQYTVFPTFEGAARGRGIAALFCPQIVRCHKIPLLGLGESEPPPCGLVLDVKPKKRASY
jgi:hypothetical protein